MDEEKKEKLENEEEVFVPEQLDDSDFEKEKEKAKEEKAAKKAAKKAEKMAEKSNLENEELDEDGNPIKTKRKRKKSEKITIAVIVIIIIALIVGVAGYLLYSLNRPENIVRDFISYVNEEDYESAVNCIDMQGYLTMAFIDVKSEEDDSSDISYTDYDSYYDSAIDELEDLGYDEITSALEYGNENYNDILGDLFSSTTITVNSVESTDRIGDTNLYKVSINLTMSDDTGNYSDETETYDIYVAKKDGEYKMVGGTFTSAIFYYYEYYYAYSVYSEE